MPVVIPAWIAGQPVRERRMREEGEGADMRGQVLSESATRCGERAVGGKRLTCGPAWSGKRRARAVLLAEAGQARARARGVRRWAAAQGEGKSLGRAGGAR